MLSAFYAECHLCRMSFMLNVIYAECHLCRVSQKALYAECHYAKCRYAECGSVQFQWQLLLV